MTSTDELGVINQPLQHEAPVLPALLPPLAAPVVVTSATSPQSSSGDVALSSPAHDGGGGHGGAWVFSPPANPPSRKQSTARKSSVASFFFASTTPTEQSAKDQNDRRHLQRLQQIPESDMYASSRRRRRRKTPFILLGSVLLFGVVAAVLLTSKGDTSNASMGEMELRTTTTTAAPPPVVPRVSPSPPPEPTTNMVTPDATRTADEMLFGSGAGDGTHVRWSKYRFYFVNKCSHPLNIFQKYRDDAPKWAFCQVPVESYGCPNNRDGAYLHTLDGGQDQATLFEITVNSTTGTHYDISIIPPGCTYKSQSLANCKTETGKVGFNLPMAVTPLHSICTPLKCLADGCQDAYQYPEDNTKDHGCRDPDAIYQVTFCPSST